MGRVNRKLRKMSHLAHVNRLLLPVTFWLLMFAQTQAEPWSLEGSGYQEFEILGGRVPKEKVFPECDEKGGLECVYDLIIIVRNAGDPLVSVRQEYDQFRTLPPPLFSSLLFDLKTSPGNCQVERLAVELQNGQSRSLELEGGALAATLPDDLSTCLGFDAGIEGTTSVMTLLWKSGAIYGWLDCDLNASRSSVCKLNYYPLALRGSNAIRVSLEISAINVKLVPTLFRSMGEIEQRVYEEISSKTEMEFSVLFSNNITNFD